MPPHPDANRSSSNLGQE